MYFSKVKCANFEFFILLTFVLAGVRCPATDEFYLKLSYSLASLWKLYSETGIRNLLVFTINFYNTLLKTIRFLPHRLRQYYLVFLPVIRMIHFGLIVTQTFHFIVN